MFTVALGLALSVGAASANNLGIINVSVEGYGATTALVKFDISWENSWRFTAGGEADVAKWPDATAIGVGFCGGGWSYVEFFV